MTYTYLVVVDRPPTVCPSPGTGLDRPLRWLGGEGHWPERAQCGGTLSGASSMTR